MDVDPIAENPDLAEALKLSGIDDKKPQEEVGPVFRMVGESKIPVSKNLGKLWQTRIQQGQAARRDIETCWSEAIRYYENDQLEHRNSGTSGNSGNSRFKRQIGDNWTETENIVFANVTAMLPMLYAKNPTIECTSYNAAYDNYVACCEKLINTLMSMKIAPGVGMKTRARRAVLWAQLTNSAYMKVNYTLKQDSSEAAQAELAKLAEEYSNPKAKKKDLQAIEGKLMAMEEKVAFLNPQGPTVSIVSPFRLIIDPTSLEPDHTDATWMAEEDYMQTDYLNAVYCKEEDGKVVTVYEPTHVLKSDKCGGEGVQDDVNNFSLFTKDPDQEAKNYGYDSTFQYKKACYTKVWWVWDKTTRRLFLFVDGKWQWPLWVWDDPLQLLEFFPYKHLWFHETVEGSQPKGEVTYYLDQQDAINDINSDISRARSWARNNIFYEKGSISQADAETVLTGPDGTAKPVEVPDGKKLTDVIFSFVPPNMQHPEVFQNQKDQMLQAINRITGINDAQRGAQFKTNTTNKAVDAYNQNVEMRVDEKTDLIEDWMGQIGWSLLQLCARYMTTDEVVNLIGEAHGQHWVQITDNNELRKRMMMTVVGGSTEKPTSKNKKQTAVQLGQVLGQFASGIPAMGMMVLKIFERAFQDDISITKEDWDMLHQSMQQTANKAGAGPGGELPQDPEQLKQLVAQLPPEAKAKLQQLVQQGVPPQEALKQVTGGQQPPASQPTK